jgi:predicted metal-binding membrane protein
MAASQIGRPAEPATGRAGWRGIALPGDRALVWGVVLGCWALAALGVRAGDGQALRHDALLGPGGPPWPVALALSLAIWQVMIGAMMLPTSLPLVWLFARMSRGQARPRLALGAFLAAYAAVWTAFALVAFAADAALHALAGRSAELSDRPWLLVGLALVLAGAFQFSPLKEQCLRECLHPVSFLLRYYQRGLGAAWRLGVRHGLFCLGCCWALMLVMFAVGMGSLAWMLALSGVMLVEKTSRRGRRLVPLVGAALLLAGGAVLLRGALLS